METLIEHTCFVMGGLGADEVTWARRSGALEEKAGVAEAARVRLGDEGSVSSEDDFSLVVGDACESLRGVSVVRVMATSGEDLSGFHSELALFVSFSASLSFGVSLAVKFSF